MSPAAECWVSLRRLPVWSNSRSASTAPRRRGRRWTWRRRSHRWTGSRHRSRVVVGQLEDFSEAGVASRADVDAEVRGGPLQGAVGRVVTGRHHFLRVDLVGAGGDGVVDGRLWQTADVLGL